MQNIRRSRREECYVVLGKELNEASSQALRRIRQGRQLGLCSLALSPSDSPSDQHNRDTSVKLPTLYMRKYPLKPLLKSSNPLKLSLAKYQ